MVMVSDAWRVRCLNCNTEGRMSVIDHSAIIYWNTRPIEDTLNKRIAELEQQNRALTHLIESMECDANGD